MVYSLTLVNAFLFKRFKVGLSVFMFDQFQGVKIQQLEDVNECLSFSVIEKKGNSDG